MPILITIASMYYLCKLIDWIVGDQSKAKNKICSNCTHFKPKSITYGVKIGECSNCIATSRPYAGDFVFTPGDPYAPDPLKVCGNFGCNRFAKK